MVNMRHAQFAEKVGQYEIQSYILNNINRQGRSNRPIQILEGPDAQSVLNRRRTRPRRPVSSDEYTLETGRDIGLNSSSRENRSPFRHHETRTQRDRMRARREERMTERGEILERLKREKLDEQEFQREEHNRRRHIRVPQPSRMRRETRRPSITEDIPRVQDPSSRVNNPMSRRSPSPIQNITSNLDRLNLQERATSLVSDLERLSVDSPNQIQRNQLRNRARDRVDSRGLACSAILYQELIEKEIDNLIREQNTCAMNTSSGLLQPIPQPIPQPIGLESIPHPEIDTMNLSQLKQFCRDNGIAGFSKFKLKDIKKFRGYIRKNFK